MKQKNERALDCGNHLWFTSARRKLLTSLTLLLTLAANLAAAQLAVTNAYDMAANYTTFSGNQGYGFGPWVLSTPGGSVSLQNGGFDIANTTANETSTATRTFNSALTQGASFSAMLRLGNEDTTDRVDGIEFQDASGNVLFSYYHYGLEQNPNNGEYTDANGSGTANGFAYNYDNWSSYTFTLNTSTTYTFTDNTTGASFTGALNGAPVAQVVFFRSNGNSTPANGQDFAFDAPLITTPATDTSVLGALDVAANYNLFNSGANQGFGFGPWVVTPDGGGNFIATGTASASGSAFDLWENNANSASTAVRPFKTPLSAGHSFSLQFELTTMQTANNEGGFSLLDSNGNRLFTYYHYGMEANPNNGEYSDANGPGTASNFPYNYLNFSAFTFTLTSATTYTFTDNSSGGSFAGTISGTISQVMFWRSNGQNAATQNGDILFDDLKLTSPWTDAPLFTEPLSDNGGVVGSSTVLNASAVSLLPMTYQWYYAGTSINGGTNASLMLTNLNQTQSGDYWVVVTTFAGSITSAVSMVTSYLESNRLLAYEGFNYSPEYLNGQQNGGSGWAGPWTTVSVNGTTYVDLNSLEGGLNAPPGHDADSQGNFLGTYGGGRVGRFLDCTADGIFAQTGYLDASANIGAAGKTLYLSFLLQPGLTSSFYEFELDRGTLGDAGRIAGIGNETITNDVYFRAPNGASVDLGPGDTAVDFYVVRIDFHGGDDDVRVYRNPTSLTEPAIPTAILLSVGKMTFNGICLGADTNYAAVDEIRLGTTWDDAVGISSSKLLPPTNQGGGWDVQFSATPDFAYHILRALNLAGPWTDVGTVAGPTNSLGTFSDSNSPATQAFYRTATYPTGVVQMVAVANSAMIGQGIAEFVPSGFDSNQVPSMSLLAEPVSTGSLTSNWSLFPQFTLVNGEASASVAIPAGTSLYGGGEVSGPLLRNGQTIKLWNTDCDDYSVDAGRRLYQAHPWAMGVRPDGTAFGVIFDSSYKASLTMETNSINFESLGPLFRVFVIDESSPQAVLQGLATLTGTISLPPRWALGYHQSRFSYTPASEVETIANTFIADQIPCDSVWMDIDYMNAYRDFTFNPTTFSNPPAIFNYLHTNGFHAVTILDCGIAVDPSYGIYQSGTANNVWTETASGSGQASLGSGYPGTIAYPDFTTPVTRSWWSGLIQNFLTNGMDGIWTDVNEPAGGPNLGTLPYTAWHQGGGGLPGGPHLLYHNVYGRLEAQATYAAELAANPNRRPFVLSRANFLGGERFATAWTGDNASTTNDMLLSIPMTLTLGLSGQPFNGPDLGGFLDNATPDLWGNWVGFGAFFPFCRGHACVGTNQKEPWAFGPTVQTAAQIALDRRYRLLPYFYTLFYNASQTGLPIMQPVFFADPTNLALRAEQQAFLVGSNLLVIPSWATNSALPGGIWLPFSLVNGDSGIYQAQLEIRGGAIIPAGAIIQNTTHNSFNPLTLIVCPDANGSATGTLYWDAGDGWGFQSGDYSLQYFTAAQTGNTITVRLDHTEGNQAIPETTPVTVQVITTNGVSSGSGLIQSGISVTL